MRKCKVMDKKVEINSECEVVIQEPNAKYYYFLGDTKIQGKGRVKRTIFLPNDVAGKLKFDDNIRVIKDGYYDLYDYVYLCNNDIVFAQKPALDTKQEYKDYMMRIPGLLPNFNIDRVVLVFLLAQECHRRNLGVSLLPWRNLQKICQDNNQNPGR